MTDFRKEPSSDDKDGPTLDQELARMDTAELATNLKKALDTLEALLAYRFHRHQDIDRPTHRELALLFDLSHRYIDTLRAQLEGKENLRA